MKVLERDNKMLEQVLHANARLNTIDSDIAALEEERVKHKAFLDAQIALNPLLPAMLAALGGAPLSTGIKESAVVKEKVRRKRRTAAQIAADKAAEAAAKAGHPAPVIEPAVAEPSDAELAEFASEVLPAA
jgi:hypothetical protein